MKYTEGCISVFNVEMKVGEDNTLSYVLKNQGMTLFDVMPNCCKILPMSLNVEEWHEDIISNDKNEELKEYSGIIDLKSIFENSNNDSNANEIEIKWNWHWPMIMFGCQTGLYLYRIFINDGFDEVNKSKMKSVNLSHLLHQDTNAASSINEAERYKLNEGNNVIKEEFDFMTTEIPISDLTLFYNNRYIIVNLLLSSFMLIKIDILSKMFKKYPFLNTMITSNFLMLCTINLSIGYLNDHLMMIPFDRNDYYIANLNMDKIEHIFNKIKRRFKELNVETDYDYYKHFLKTTIDNFINLPNGLLIENPDDPLGIPLYQSINGFCNHTKLGLNLNLTKGDNCVLYYASTGTIGMVKEVLEEDIIKINHEIGKLLTNEKIKLKENEFIPCLIKKMPNYVLNSRQLYFDGNAAEKAIEILKRQNTTSSEVLLNELKLKIENI